MKRVFAGGVFSLLLLMAMVAQATTVVNVSFAPPFGNLGSATHTYGGLITAHGYYFDGTSWVDANLWGRGGTNDWGVGVCNPVEFSTCVSGGGDVNELDNAGNNELIRLTLPNGWDWVSVQLSSLDNNGKTDPALWERGQLEFNSSGDPNDPTSTICTFAAGGSFSCTVVGGTGIEPVLGISPADRQDRYLFFRPFDWTGGDKTNNDFLVKGATIITPEPASMMLLGTGLLAIIGGVRRKLRG